MSYPSKNVVAYEDALSKLQNGKQHSQPCTAGFLRSPEHGSLAQRVVVVIGTGAFAKRCCNSTALGRACYRRKCRLKPCRAALLLLVTIGTITVKEKNITATIGSLPFRICSFSASASSSSSPSAAGSRPGAVVNSENEGVSARPAPRTCAHPKRAPGHPPQFLTTTEKPQISEGTASDSRKILKGSPRTETSNLGGDSGPCFCFGMGPANQLLRS